MASVFITGSTDGLGLAAARSLLDQGHQVVLHARSTARASAVADLISHSAKVVIGDLGNATDTRSVADQVNALGRMDAIIHNAGIGYREQRRIETVDGLPHVFAVNTLAPYLLTALIYKPQRLVYVSSGMHRGGDSSLRDLVWKERAWNGSSAYADTKLHDVILAFAVARKWMDVLSNAIEPGWVPTRMGGPGAPDDLDEGPKTQVWLATSDEPAARVTGQYFYHMKRRAADPAASDPAIQEKLLGECARLSGVPFPA